jgi:hypothetical protein
MAFTPPRSRSCDPRGGATGCVGGPARRLAAWQVVLAALKLCGALVSYVSCDAERRAPPVLAELAALQRTLLSLQNLAERRQPTAGTGPAHGGHCAGRSGHVL